MARSTTVSLLGMLVVSSVVAAQEPGTVAGRVVDAASSQPVADVVVRAADEGSALTNERGIFRLAVSPGQRRLVFEHVGYGTHTQTVTVLPGVETALLVRLSQEAIELSPILVETLTDLEERRLTSGNSINEIGAEQIDAAARAGFDLGALIQSSLPGVDIRRGGAGVCVTYRAVRTGNNRGDCDGIAVRVDGVPVSDPMYIYNSMPLQDIERVEVLSPGQAGVRYGMRSGQGVLLIETKRAEEARARDVSRYLTGFGWEGESKPYPWAKVLGGAILTNAVGVGLSLALADRCFSTPEENPLALRTSCGGATTTAASILSVGVPAVSTGLVARSFGATERSRGRLVPSVVGAGMMLTGGYLMVIGGDGGNRVAGGVMLAVGVPVAQTLLDRVLRIRR